MDFGIGIASGVDAGSTVARAETLGFSHAWFYDTQMLCADVFVAMALAAARTSRIRLGTGVLVPSNRIAPVTANAFASLAKLTPGRLDLGVGTGFTARNTMGLGAMRLADLREYVRVVRALLAGETVEWECEGRPRTIRFLDPDLGLIDLRHPVPVHISAFGPRSRALTVEIADGWMHFVGRLAAGVRDLGAIAEACRAAGRRPESLYTTSFTVGCVLRDGEAADSPRARAQAGPFAMTFFHALAYGSLPMRVPSHLAGAVEEYRRLYRTYEPAHARYLRLHTGHFMRVRPEEQRFLDARLLRDMTFTAPAEELRERIRALRDAGCRQLAICLVPGHEDALEDWARVVEKI
jgi:alkanesulfonate monooxygenase SsuD/methylene tetrahydromethanopterin reductase-like flavin-dependent oxidoreductase (luciferase family)